MEQSILEEQKEYYAARAGEYDEWFYRKGRYDRGEESNAEWFAEAAQVRDALREFRPRGRVLDLAAGTGIWTLELAKTANSVLALDASAEVLNINKSKLEEAGLAPKAKYQQADLFEWAPDERFDVIFFGFWLSHVPPERFVTFWNRLASWLNPGGRVFFVDSRRDSDSSAVDHRTQSVQETLSERKLNDGRTFNVVKIFYDPNELRQQLERLGWTAAVRETTRFFLYGEASTL